MKKGLILLLASLLIIITGTSPGATTISYTTADLGSGTWQYTYQVSNDTLSSAIDEFTIYFDYGLYSNLSLPSPKANWDELTLDPDLVLGVPVPGYYDVLALVTGIAPGSSESGFAVAFTWLGEGTPGSQAFDIVNPETFEPLDSGQTTVAAVPEPSILWLLASGCPALIMLRRRLFAYGRNWRR